MTKTRVGISFNFIVHFQRSFDTTQHRALIGLLVLSYDTVAYMLDVILPGWCRLKNSKARSPCWSLQLPCLPISVLFQLDHIMALIGKAIQYVTYS